VGLSVDIYRGDLLAGEFTSLDYKSLPDREIGFKYVNSQCEVMSKTMFIAWKSQAGT
jgi:hypothetical protein